jgi:hypothetical protein
MSSFYEEIENLMTETIHMFTLHIAEKYNIPQEDLLNDWKTVVPPISSLPGKKKKKTHKKKKVSAWQVFSKEYRQKVKEADPTATFGEISKRVGEKWASFTAYEKSLYTPTPLPDDAVSSESAPMTIAPPDSPDIVSTPRREDDDDITNNVKEKEEYHDDASNSDEDSSTQTEDNVEEEGEEQEKGKKVWYEELETLKMTELRHMCEQLNISKTGKKDILIQRIMESSHT